MDDILKPTIKTYNRLYAYERIWANKNVIRVDFNEKKRIFEISQ